MSLLSAGAVIQFVTSAACDFSLKKAEVEQGPLLCSILTPTIQAAGNYIYQRSVTKTSDIGASSASSTLKPLEEAAASILGAYAGYGALKISANSATDFFWKWLNNFPLASAAISVKENSLMRAGMAVAGTQAITHLAAVVTLQNIINCYDRLAFTFAPPENMNAASKPFNCLSRNTMGFLSVGAVTQFVATAACDFSFKKAEMKDQRLLCASLVPAMQVAGKYIYQETITKTSDTTPSSPSSMLEMVPSVAGAHAVPLALKKVGYAVYDFLWERGTITPMEEAIPCLLNNPLVRAGMAVLGTQAATYVADIVKQTYLSSASSSAAEQTSQIKTEA